MDLTSLQRKYDDFYTPRFAVTIDGETYSESHGVITDVSVDATLGGADRFSLSVNTLFDHETQRFTDLDWEQFRTGASITIELGYGDRLEELLRGSIDEVMPRFPESGTPTVEVSGYGPLHDMAEGTDSDSWDETTDAEVVQEVADEYEFGSIVVDDTGVSRPKVVQDDESDFAFLQRLAERNDAGNGPFEVYSSRGDFHFAASDDTGDPVVTLAYGDSLLSFEPKSKDVPKVETLEVRHWDPKRKESIVGTATNEGGEGKRVERQPVRSRAEADAVASAKLTKAARGRLTGRGETIGLPELRIGEPIELGGLGDRYSATYYVTDTTHRVGTDGYTTQFEVRLPDGEALA
ncbi:phage late control D family protein [Halopenitus sp. H-Gu1]|uniref:phage late control D family protein n=1 Tax=Halopenitus sp. H-Gu1 TaxID=3242697 RepID=UPI00359D6636